MKKEKRFNLKPSFKKTLLIINLVVVSLACFLLLDDNKNKTSLLQLQNAANLINGKTKHKDYLYNLAFDNFNLLPILNVQWNLKKGFDNTKYYQALEYGVVLSTYEKTGLKVLSAHDFSHFNFLKKVKIGDKFKIINKSTAKYLEYQVYSSNIVSESDADVIFNDELDAKKDLVLFTCAYSKDSSLNPTKRLVLYAKKIGIGMLN